MANDKHVALLKQDVEAWNAWRRENPNVPPDLSEADLNGAILSMAWLTEAAVSDADLHRAILRSGDFSEADLIEIEALQAWIEAGRRLLVVPPAPVLCHWMVIAFEPASLLSMLR